MRLGAAQLLLAAAACAQRASAQPLVGPLPAGLAATFEGWFGKHASAFGVSILATSDTADADVLHAANVMCEYLDNDEDGEPDDPAVVAHLLAAKAMLVMFPTSEGLAAEERIADFFANAPAGHRYQDLAGDECRPSRPMNPGLYDAAVEEVLHLISGYGWSGAHPEIFGECYEGHDPGGSETCVGSLLAQQMERQIADCGFAFNGTRRQDCTGFYHYDDESCDYPCLVAEYIYWSFTTSLGGQTVPVAPARCERIADEWQLCTPEMLELHDPVTAAIFRDPVLKLPTRLPDGIYRRDVDGFTDETCR